MSEQTRTAELAVVMVTWNTRTLALEALRSLFADLDAHGPDADVYVMDSGSSDGTPEAIASEFPEVVLVKSKSNLGFGAANNLALRQIGFCQGDKELPRAVYLLNPDTITQAGATRTLYDTLMAHPKWGLCGARLTYGDGSFQHSAFTFPGLRQLWVEFFPTPGRLIEGSFNGRYPRRLYDTGQPFPVDFVLGATMMLRREAVEQTGMFDEKFFMYCEETDWAKRIHDAGWGVYCVPAAHVVHLAGKSTTQVLPQSIIYLWESRFRLFEKYYPRWKLWLARKLIAVGMACKIQQARHSSLIAEEPDAVINAYRTVQRMAMYPHKVG
jgi:GT2 family glycosyltransferase